ncbi:Phosphate-binding protein PstS precursor [Roseimaritima multifibrata]|uniref:Phosphate-binding protein n=1 Tax=Roseimaritima multifibrata TaxID=1930274 RepID=A0A517MKZ7_9BACT|nr:PstS family phosphate ABC transporter substrate-binding protein [Roseimaritima multifibrata]QDS95553.1 Phosphate-binding protein PstS precursor [Roseimaritima multifibrata]
MTLVSKLFCNGMTLACITLMLTGCESKQSDSTDPVAPVSSLTGDVKIDGSSTVLPISNAIKEKFSEAYPEVNVSVAGSGTGNGFNRFSGKETDISGASRPIKPGELEACKEAGIEFIELPVAYDGLTLVIHPENDWVKQLSIEQLKKIFVGSDAVKKWSDIDPTWPEEDLKIFAPGVGSGTYDYFHEVMAKKDKAELRKDMTLNEDDNVLVQGVAGNKYSIGFFGVAYFEENKDKLQAVPIINPSDDTAYLPTQENIASGKYAPFSRPLLIYVNAASLNNAQVQTLAEYYLQNASETSEQVGYVRLPEEVIQRGIANLDAQKTGSHYVDAEGQSRSGSVADIFVEANRVE